VYGMLSDADLRFPTIRDEDGDEVELTKGRYLTFLESPDRRVRREAFTALYRVYESKVHTFAALFAASVKKDVFFARARHYRSALEAALTPNRIPVAVYTQLIDTVRRHLPLLHRYLALRKKALGLDELHMYDLYVPLARLKRTVPYEKAAELVTRALAVLGDDYVRVLKEAFASRWIDVYENRGKRSGAYSWGAYGTHPYVLLNYQGTLHDVFTLAHEMGHALHSHYSWTHQPYVYAHYRIFVAEVASTVNEILLVRHLLARTQDPTERLALLHHQLEQFRTTVFRQTMFAEFEKWAHEQVEGGQPLTAETLCTQYRQLNEAYHGPAVTVDPQIAYEWARIPHFYTPFYVYQYATGYAAAIALAQGILERPKEAVPRYLAFLKAGSSDTPIALLQRAGVDMTRPEPIEKALAVFADLVDELERLVGA
ncbi:MAG TPA: oligoendopeptidase F, partial [Calditerricola sp.]